MHRCAKKVVDQSDPMSSVSSTAKVLTNAITHRKVLAAEAQSIILLSALAQVSLAKTGHRPVK